MLRTHYANQITPQMDGEEVTIAGWLHEVRNIGKIAFMLVRDHTGIVQVIAKKGVVADEIIDKMNMPKESVVLVTGIAKASKESKKGFELVPKNIENLNPLSAPIPFEVTGKVPADMDVRLDYRYIDLRRAETTAIFNIQSTILSSFREFLVNENFQEIRPTSLVEAATEGGSDLFSVDYFEKKAYLVQSPQLYKQLAVIGGMDRVFMVTPVFRAEKHNTVYHLNEATQMDIEMGFADHEDAIAMLKKTILHVVKEVEKKNSKDIELLNQNVDSESDRIDLSKMSSVYDMTYEDAIEELRAQGTEIKFGDDLGRAEEEKLCKMHGDLVLVRKYPTMLRSFYTMPSSDDPKVSNSYDLLFRGLEILSGAQRIHKADMLIDALNKRGIDPKNFEFYINAFKRGAPPHAGWSIGLERLTMKITGMSNIRECSMFPRDRVRLYP